MAISFRTIHTHYKEQSVLRGGIVVLEKRERYDSLV